METKSLKALSVLRLQGYQQGNQKETLGFPQMKFKGTNKKTNTKGHQGECFKK
jgi:hypothetical protein